MLGEPCRASLLLGLTCGHASSFLGSLRGRELCRLISQLPDGVTECPSPTGEEFGIERLFLVSHGRRLPIAGFLGPREKEAFALALSAALGEARRGPTRAVLE